MALVFLNACQDQRVQEEGEVKSFSLNANFLLKQRKHHSVPTGIEDGLSRWWCLCQAPNTA